MKRDTLKTLAGLAVIAIIVAATYFYGNSQRQAQVRHDQDVKKQQQAKANEQAAKSSNSPQASTPPTGGTGISTNTAPVTSPMANSIQGSAKATPTPAAGQVAGTAATAPLPETGAPTTGLIGVSAIGIMWYMVRRSRLGIMQKARARRGL